jgi:hypothetical protein
MATVEEIVEVAPADDGPVIKPNPPAPETDEKGAPVEAQEPPVQMLTAQMTPQDVAALEAQAPAPLRAADQRFLLMYFAQHDGKTALLPVAAFADDTETGELQATRKRLQETAQYNNRYHCAVVPLGKWGSLDGDATAILAGHFAALRAEAERLRAAELLQARGEAKPGVEGCTAEVRALLDRLKAQQPPMPPPQQIAAEQQQPQRQAPDSDRKAADVPAALQPINLYKPGQQEAFNALTSAERLELRRRLLHAQRTNNRAELDAIGKKFGPIALVGQPELRDTPPPADAKTGAVIH